MAAAARSRARRSFCSRCASVCVFCRVFFVLCARVCFLFLCCFCIVLFYFHAKTGGVRIYGVFSIEVAPYRVTLTQLDFEELLYPVFFLQKYKYVFLVGWNPLRSRENERRSFSSALVPSFGCVLFPPWMQLGCERGCMCLAFCVRQRTTSMAPVHRTLHRCRQDFGFDSATCPGCRSTFETVLHTPGIQSYH